VSHADETIPPEAPTKPDLATYPCPYCRGDNGEPTGLVLDLQDWERSQKAVARRCRGCNGTLAVDREQMERFKMQAHEAARTHAIKHGRTR
jgi:hypothetical protein